MEAGESAAFVVAQAAGPLEAAQGDRQVNIDAYALGQSVLNVALIVCILKLKRRSEDRGPSDLDPAVARRQRGRVVVCTGGALMGGGDNYVDKSTAQGVLDHLRYAGAEIRSMSTTVLRGLVDAILAEIVARAEEHGR